MHAASVASSTYLHRAQIEPALLADRHAMLDLYQKDMSDFGASLGSIPARDASCIRLVTWNVNCLRGVDGSSIISADEVASALRAMDADVIALQEVPADFDASWGNWLVEPIDRIKELDAWLREQGYMLFRSPATNPTLLATRLPTAYTEGFKLDAQPVRSQNGDAVWSESRGAYCAEVHVANSQLLRVYATHLHHKDVELRADDDVHVPGVRKREASVLLEHCEVRQRSARAEASVVLADFNQPIRKHYDDAEWGVVAAGLSHPAVSQPEADGVAEAFEDKGFRCCFDSARSNS
eukprot:TRINITY_DN11472_c0_g2_i1.p2 TRINITY_DN11472_c0_g2~~TRINITY_DN11472_c0_g2_i1.p2  ORF type:complete len:313 (+),score=38.08 TRINITY_DN11472_c0_g2_i1:57-941(+)